MYFEKLSVKEIRRETADCVSVTFDIPEMLRNKFRYEHGQYITIRSFINNQEIRRSYSLCSSPLEKEWRIAVKKTPGGLFSCYANDHLKAGDVLEVSVPEGRFYTPVSAAQSRQYVVVAAGSGITPVISIVKTILFTELSSTVTLIYGNRNRHSVIFKEELEQLKNRFMHRFRLIHIFSREITDAAINTGRIDAGKCNELFPRLVSTQAHEYFICGPEDMTLCVRQFLLDNDVELRRIHIELFAAGRPVKDAAAPLLSEVNEEASSKVTVKLDGRYFHFDLPYDGESILDAAMRHGADVPFSCKGGVCCTCRAKLTEGEADMEVNYALEQDEVAEGFILTCQAHPRSAHISVDFDAK